MHTFDISIDIDIRETKTKKKKQLFEMAGVHREAIQKQIHQDWANREYIEVITASIKRITDFLNSFGNLNFFSIHFTLQ